MVLLGFGLKNTTMNLIIDAGNTLIKYFIFKNDEIIHTHQTPSKEEITFKPIFNQFPSIKNIILSSVSTLNTQIPSEIEELLKTYIILDHTTQLPIKNNYNSKATLGKDRIAAVVGANNIFPHNNVLVVDAGTAITFPC